MKCKKHPLFEQGVGVCASCLRERLLAVIAVQSGHNRCSPAPHPPPSPPPFLFPRSVSPYVSSRRSADPDLPPSSADSDPLCRRGHLHLRFYSTPQVDPAADRRKKGSGGFSILSFLFGHHPRSVDPEEGRRVSSASDSSSWFSALLPGRRKKNKRSRFFAETEEEGAFAGRLRRTRCRDRGMSPANDDEVGGKDDNSSESGCSTDSSTDWRRPAPSPMRRHAPAAHRAAPGFSVCLSPLVRASPRRCQPGESGGVASVGLSSELRNTFNSHHHRHHHHHHHRHRHVSGGGGALVLGPNRSRKLADFGRFH